MSGFLLSLNPKNLVLVIAGSATIDSSMATPSQQAIALGVFTLVASITVITPIVACYLFPERSRLVLDGLKDWMMENSAAVLAVIRAVFGIVVVWNGLAILST